MAVSKTLFAAVAVLCFTQVLGAKRSQNSQSVTNQLEQAAARAQEAISNVTSEVSQTLGLNNLPSAEQVAEDLHNQSLGFAHTVGQLVGQLQNELASHDDGQFTNLLQSVAAKWNETATNLQTQNPQITRSAQELQSSFNSGLTSFFEEAEKLVQAIAPNAQQASDNLRQITQTALERVQETAHTFTESLQATTQQNHPH